MPKTEDLIIRDFNKGIGLSPHIGFGSMRNVDVHGIPGVVRINNILQKVTSTTVTGLVNWIVRSPYNANHFYAVDDDGNLYRSTDGGSSWSLLQAVGGKGQGLAIWKDYVFISDGSFLNIYGPLSGSPSYTDDFANIPDDADWQPLLVSANDGNLYCGAGRYVSSLSETVGDTFDPSDSASYTFNAQALDLPANYRVKCLAELGENLAIGTWWGTGVSQFKVADVFFWPRSGPSFSTPLHLQRHGVHAMTTINNLLYICAGIYGEVLVSNGVQAQVAGKVPDNTFDLDLGGFLLPSPGGITNHKNRLFFTLSQQAIGSSMPNGAGVWSLYNDGQSTSLVCEDTPSDGFVNSENFKIGGLCSLSNNQYLVGWDAPSIQSTAGIDLKDDGDKYTGYLAFIETPFYRVGTILREYTFQDLEFQLAKPLASGEGVRIKYRTNLNASYTTIGTYDFSGLGAVISHRVDPGIPKTEFVQLRIELTSGGSTSPELRTVTLR